MIFMYIALIRLQRGSNMAKKGCLFFLLAIISLGSTQFSDFCSAAGYPDHNIQLVVPYPAGSGADITARLLIEELEKILGQKIIPNNKPGASSVLGTDSVIKSKKDGYTLLYGSSAVRGFSTTIRSKMPSRWVFITFFLLPLPSDRMLRGKPFPN
jgi:tripartite-type tricarboxylate transporter receptor subunit TctC